MSEADARPDFTAPADGSENSPEAARDEGESGGGGDCRSSDGGEGHGGQNPQEEGAFGDEAGIPSDGPKDWEAEAKRFEDLYLRSVAEAENSKRRFQKEREETSRFATEGVLRDLLPFLDNLNLALSYADTGDPAVKNLAEGVAMTLKGCMDKLSDWGLKEVEVAIGQPFDPNFQEAIGQAPNPALPDKSVGHLVAKGYALHGRLLRPAKVMVVKNPEPQGA
jgi:molecular chaperone GrpE